MDKKTGIIVGVIAVIVIAAIIIFAVVGGSQNNDSNTDHKVTYDCNGGSYEGQSVLTYNEKTFVYFTPSRDGYGFDGWYKNKDDWSGKMSEGDIITSDITVYAKWNTNFKLYHSGTTSINDGNVFSVVGKTETTPISMDHQFTGYSLPDNGKSKLIATSGSEFTIIKDQDNDDCLRYKVGDTYYYTMFSFIDAKNVTYRIDSATGMGYVEFEYDKSVYLSYATPQFGVKYYANGGTFSDISKEYKFVFTSLIVVDNTAVSLTAPAGKTFDGWYTEAEGGNKVNVGDTISLKDSAHAYVELYAHYTDVPPS